MLVKKKSAYAIDKYFIHYNYNSKNYIIFLNQGEENLVLEFQEYFGDVSFKAKNKKEILINLTNFSHAYNIKFNPIFKHIQTTYYDTENKVMTIKIQNKWLVIKLSKNIIAKLVKKLLIII